MDRRGVIGLNGGWSGRVTLALVAAIILFPLRGLADPPTLYELAVNDYVELVVYQSSGGALNVVSSGNHSPEFMMVYQGRV